jgi:hypothetical protein
MGPLAEKVVVASILPPHLRENKFDLSKSSLEDLECWQCNSRVFNYICSTLSDDVHDFIYEKLEIDAHTIWEILLEEYEKPKWIDREQTMEMALEESSKTSFNKLSLKCHIPSKEKGKEVKTLSLCRDRSDRCTSPQTGASRGTNTFLMVKKEKKKTREES